MPSANPPDMIPARDGSSDQCKAPLDWLLGSFQGTVDCMQREGGGPTTSAAIRTSGTNPRAPTPARNGA